MRWLVSICLALILASGAVLQSQAASVIFYSKADNSYGWCAGYSYGRSESCAREQCLGLGTKCELAIECEGGWSAAAFANDPWTGFGASCEWQDANTARSVALLSCIYVSHALCYTSQAFNGSGKTSSEKSNAAFDTAWYAQSMLADLGYDIGTIDGAIGSRTKAAIRQFQTAIGVEATGEADGALVQLLLFNSGGTRRFVDRVVAETDTVDEQTIANYTYRYADAAAGDQTLSTELAALAQQDRLAVLASIVNFANVRCGFPAVGAGPQAGSPDTWAVACAEQSYLVTFGGTAPTIVASNVSIDCPATDSAAADSREIAPDETRPSPLSLGSPMPNAPAAPVAQVPNAPPQVDCVATSTEFKPSLITLGTPPPSDADAPADPPASPLSIGGTAPQ